MIVLSSPSKEVLKSSYLWLDDTSMELMRSYVINFQSKVDSRCYCKKKTISTVVPILSGFNCVLFSQNCLLMKSNLQRYNSSSKNVIQIINVESKHWICASNIHCPAEVVDVYDSKPSCSSGSHNICTNSWLLLFNAQTSVCMSAMSMLRDNLDHLIVTFLPLHLQQHCAWV